MTLIVTLLIIFALGLICEWINATIGMGYGTILAAVLVILGVPVLTAVPAILISQGLSGLTASYFHHQFRNVHFAVRGKNGKMSDDLRAALWIAGLGLVAVVFAAFVGVKVISKETLATYIGALVLSIGFLVLVGFKFDYAPWKMKVVGLVSAFNKGLSGGGFGPLVTGSQMVLGSKHTNAVGVTMLAEGPICIAGFLSYWALGGIKDWDITIALTLGAVLASKAGAKTTRKLDQKRLREMIAVTLIVLGTMVLLKRFGLIPFSLSL